MYLKKQNLWYLISGLFLLPALVACSQKQKSAETSVVPKTDTAISAVPVVAADNALMEEVKTDSIAPEKKETKTSQNPQNETTAKGANNKRKEVHAPLPEKLPVKDAERLEKERLKKKREGREED